ncbi:hypothetical protein GCM10025771_15830 [Niveibacterium umoris]|uniref:Uncharacterized protein n=1 Tax=Niveibacterium umoris TaxID=1193620 RepID=A0A840BW62_9RHOO|nr:hypothetical protein [Niveibacterium umoris]MBB4014547.1 hypothetical protein [Niveibacterium umoris]
MKKSPLAPRNPLVAAALLRKAGAHQKTGKALRRAERIALLANLNAARRNNGDDGSFSGQAHAARVCFAGTN